MCNSTLFSFLWAKKEMLILSENVPLLLGTKVYALTEKMSTWGLKRLLPLLLLPSLKPQSLASVVETVKQKAKKV